MPPILPSLNDGTERTGGTQSTDSTNKDHGLWPHEVASLDEYVGDGTQDPLDSEDRTTFDVDSAHPDLVSKLTAIGNGEAGIESIYSKASAETQGVGNALDDACHPGGEYPNGHVCEAHVQQAQGENVNGKSVIASASGTGSGLDMTKPYLLPSFCLACVGGAYFTYQRIVRREEEDGLKAEDKFEATKLD
ncbi:hypothetical protein QFC19_003931 [Naganishia cerealis]|uniref:Uncharacterized protein n=1 Tax=Naganishia cerealis TaxID=610337 RepID=A0ACC2W0Z2_9TREE|nr:hypothetical protein QFC19_003931 [Naganishia cerealis]